MGVGWLLLVAPFNASALSLSQCTSLVGSFALSPSLPLERKRAITTSSSSKELDGGTGASFVVISGTK